MADFRFSLDASHDGFSGTRQYQQLFTSRLFGSGNNHDLLGVFALFYKFKVLSPIWRKTADKSFESDLASCVSFRSYSAKEGRRSFRKSLSGLPKFKCVSGRVSLKFRPLPAVRNISAADDISSNRL